jgi:hypothetical protein
VTTTDNAWFKLLTRNTAPVLLPFHEYWAIAELYFQSPIRACDHAQLDTPTRQAFGAISPA